MGADDRRRSRGGRTLLALLVCLLPIALAGAARAQPAQAYVIKIDGEINEAYSRAVQRKIEAVRAEGGRLIILELDTPGGQVGASMELADYIFLLDDVDVVAYVHPNAYSGGTLVALACKKIYIADKVGIMGDVEPRIGGQRADEKTQTAIREKMEGYAQARGYPVALTDAMVTREIEVSRVQLADEPEGTLVYLTDARLREEEQRGNVVSKQLVVPAGQLLTMRAENAVEYGFASKAVSSPEDLYDVLKVDPGSVKRIYLRPSERLLTILDTFSPLLIIAGFVLLFIELTHPGFGLPGILGISCFVVFFIIKITLQYARLLEVLLFVAGLALLLVEVFITPGFGLLGISGIVLMFVALLLTFQEFGIPTTAAEAQAFQWNLLKVTGSFLGAAVGIGLLLHFLPTMPLLKRLVHDGSLAEAHAGDLSEVRTPGLSQMVGTVGVALTALRPAGRAEFGETLLDVVTEGEFIARGVRIQILDVVGNRVVVAPYAENGVT
jgi:membrane-bound serine protease (ClpP class)